MSRFCPKCGSGIVGDERFCGSCGSALPPETVAKTISTNAAPVDVVYDAAIIRKFANMLYRQATLVVITNTLIGAAIGCGIYILLMILGSIASMGSARGSDDGIIIGAAIGGAIGFWQGLQKAYWLKLHAQVALCQVEIEHNTRALRETD